MPVITELELQAGRPKHKQAWDALIRWVLLRCSRQSPERISTAVAPRGVTTGLTTSGSSDATVGSKRAAIGAMRAAIEVDVAITIDHL